MSAVAEADTDLKLSISFDDGAVVALAGELDLVSVPDVAVVLDALVDRGHRRVTIDCTNVEFMDASALGVFTDVHARLAGNGGEIRIHGASPMAYRVFEITELLDVLQVARADPNARRELGHAGEPDPILSHAARLAAESAHGDALADTLTRMAVLIPEIITACDGASVTLRRRDYLMTAAASNDTALDLDLVQYADQQGPCLEAATTGIQTHAPALANEERWRSFVPQARGRGIESILSSPLSVDDEPIGALNLYSRTPDAFLPIHQDLAEIFATQTALLLREPDDTTAHEFDGRIHEALASRDVIAKAQGVLMERLDVDARTAYTALRRESVATATPLRTRAGDIVAGTQLRPAPASEVPSNE